MDERIPTLEPLPIVCRHVPEKEDLDHADYDLCNVPKSGSQNPQHKSHPVPVQANEDHHQGKENKVASRREAEDQQHDNHDDHVVKKDDQVSPEHPKNMNPKGQGDLFDDAFGLGEDLCSVG